MNARRANRSQNNPKKVTFESIFEETLPHTNFIWQPVDNANQPEPQLTILSGKLLLKGETETWEPYLFELQADGLFRMGDILECCYLRGCFLKKFNHSDVAYPMHKYGFRIQLGQQLAFFITDSPDQFKKWFLMLKRFCILEKFTRKYKVIAQLKYNDPIFQQVCFTCVRLSDAGYYLVKIIPKDLSQQQKNVLFKELHHLRRLNHPQLMRLIEVYEDENNLYQVFDQYMGGDLRQHLRETSQAYEVGGQIEEKILADMMFGLIGALAHMHSRGVFHRDIKLDNLFVPENRRLPFVLLSNFCYSESFKLSGPSPGYKKCGTPGYVAPEIFKSKNYDAKIDVFSLGVVLYILVYGRMPFEGQDQEEILKCNERCEIDFKAERKLCKAISNSGIDLMKKMLDKDPNKRFTSLQALNHHWFIKNKSKDDSKPKQLQKMRSLSTIVENSEIMELTQSFIGKSNYKVSKQQVKNNQFNQIQAVKRSQQRQETVEKIEKEFSFDNLEAKMQYFNQDLFAKAPSKKRHQL